MNSPVTFAGLTFWGENSFRMSRSISESEVVRELADRICQRLTRRTIAGLQKMRNGLLSGEGSGLQNTWDEICAQLQLELSLSWDLYDEVVRDLSKSEIEQLQPYEREAIWFQTSEGDRWLSNDGSARDGYPVLIDDIVEYFLSEHLYRAATNWNNRRIREYLERSVID